MTYTVLMALLVFVLSAAGVIAYQNSKLMSDQKTNGHSVRNASRMYSIFDKSSAARVDDPSVIPLFQFTVFAEQSGRVAVNKRVSSLILCRVEAGAGEKALADAENFMVDSIRVAVPPGTIVEHRSFLHRAANHSEKEMIMNLEDVVKLHYT
jgi:hypothetical protein